MAHLKTPRGYAEDFDPVWYLDTYIKTLNQQSQNRGILPFALDFLHDTFNTCIYKGEKLLDIGTGPTVHTVISASRHVREIHLSDISPRNRDILQKWRNGEPNVVELFDYFSRKENDGIALQDRINLVREKVTQIYDVDMQLPDPLPGSGNKYDIVVASLVLCAVARNNEEFTEVLSKAVAMVKPGGYLIVVGVLNTSKTPWYQVGEFRFHAPDVHRGDMKGLFERDDLQIIDWRETKPDYDPNYKEQGCSSDAGVFAMVGQRV